MTKCFHKAYTAQISEGLKIYKRLTEGRRVWGQPKNFLDQVTVRPNRRYT
jgi:hypothetical protein